MRTYEELQNEFYTLSFPTPESRKARRDILRDTIDPGPFAVFIWTTKDNHMIPVTYMRESHIRNAYRYVYRRVAGVIYLYDKNHTELIDIAQWDNDTHSVSQLRQELQRRGVESPPEDPRINEVDDCLNPDYYGPDSWGHPLEW